MTIYERQEVFDETLKYFSGDELATNVWIDKYCLKDSDGNLFEKTPDDMHHRIASELARVENKYDNPMSEDEIYGLLKDFKYVIPQGSMLFGIGNDIKTSSLANCYIIGTEEDSYASIMKMDEEMVHIYRNRGGVGLDLSFIRPKDSPVNNVAITSTGVVPFMNRYSNTTGEVAMCLIFDSMVLTKRGLIEIQHVTTSDEVWTRVGWVNVINVIDSGTKQTYKIKTKRGFEVISSDEHIYLNRDNVETKLKEFKIGDDIVMLAGTNVNEKTPLLESVEYISTQPKSISNLKTLRYPSKLNEDVAYLLGYSYGDGHLIKGRNGEYDGISLSVHADDTDIIKRLTDIIVNEFGITPSIYDGSGNCKTIQLISVKFMKWLQHNEIAKEKSQYIKIPSKILESNGKIQMAFFSGHFDADGYAHITGKNVRATSISEDFIVTMQQILLANGIISNIQTSQSTKPNHKLEYRLNIQGTYSQSKLKNISNSIKIMKMDRVSLQDHILTPFTHKDFPEIKNIRKKYSYIPNYANRKMSTSALSRLYESTNNPSPISFLDEIISIEPYGTHATYDLMLEKEHLFYCDGFIVHNSGRRGALLLGIDAKHPDSQDFINAKSDTSKVTNANVSVKIDDDFMNAVASGSTIIQQFPLESDSPIVSNEVQATPIWNSIIHNAWKSAEPGILFKSRFDDESISDCYVTSSVSNPCGEIVMNPYSSCILMVLNMLNYVNDPYTDSASFDYELFDKHAHIGQRLLDDVIDLELEKLDKILNKLNEDPESDETKRVNLNLWNKVRDNLINIRRTGLGITAMADAIAALGLEYASDNAIAEIEKIFNSFTHGSFMSTVVMAKERGTFELYDHKLEKDHNYINRIKSIISSDEFDEYKKYGRRNISTSTISPGGSISLLAQTSSGFEPIFMLNYVRRKKSMDDTNVAFVDEVGIKWSEYEVFHHGFDRWFNVNKSTLGYGDTKMLSELTSDELNTVISNSPFNDSLATEVDPLRKLKIQSILQKHITHSISNTYNLPEDVTEKVVSDLYFKAWEYGLKGITVYRQGSRSGVLVSKDDANDQSNSNAKSTRPLVLECDIHHVQADLKKYYVIVGLVDDKPYEIFAFRKKHISIPQIRKEGKLDKIQTGVYNLRYNGTVIEDIAQHFESPEEDGFTRMVSLLLRRGNSLQDIVDQIDKSYSNISSFYKVISRTLRKFYISDDEYDMKNEKCPECGAELIMNDGCKSCPACSWSKCG